MKWIVITERLLTLKSLNHSSKLRFSCGQIIVQVKWSQQALLLGVRVHYLPVGIGCYDQKELARTLMVFLGTEGVHWRTDFAFFVSQKTTKSSLKTECYIMLLLV